MPLIIDSADEKTMAALREPLILHSYNCLDATVTEEVRQEIAPQLYQKPCLTPQGERHFEAEVYEFSRVLQAPVAEMMRTGLRIDDYARGALIDRLAKERDRLKGWLMRLLREGLELDDPAYLANFNINSVAPPSINKPTGGDVQRLFYDILQVPIVLGDTGKPSVDRDALEKLARYPAATPFCNLLIALRDIKKTLEDLRFEIDADGRIRTSLSIAGTTTGRMASYKATTGTGRNLQNVDPLLRHIYCADKGRKFAYIDLEQAESRLVGAIIWSLFGDAKYLDATEDADLHTAIARMVWPTEVKTRDDADKSFYRNFSYRFLCKRIGHGSNYVGTPRTISKETSVPFRQVGDFQSAYFTAFPGIRRWHAWVAEQLAAQGFLVSLMGRKRWFMGRADDDATIREAVAFDPQSSIADLLNRGLLRLWWKSKTEPERYPIRLLLQVHDAVLLDYPEDTDETVLLPLLINTIVTPITLQHKEHRRQLIIPAAAQIGFNWGEPVYDKAGNIIGNRDGLTDFRGRDTRRRESDPDRCAILDRPIFESHG